MRTIQPARRHAGVVDARDDAAAMDSFRYRDAGEAADDRTLYYYQRALGPRELLPAVGVGLGIGLVAFYVARRLMERTPLEMHGSSERSSRRGG